MTHPQGDEDRSEELVSLLMSLDEAGRQKALQALRDLERKEKNRPGTGSVPGPGEGGQL